MKNRTQLIIASMCLLFIGFHSQAQETSSESELTKKELRAKRKKAREIQRMNDIYQIHEDARALLKAKDFVLKSDGRSGRTTTNFFRIHGDTVTIQLWSEFISRPMKVEGTITDFYFLDGGDDGPIQAEINFVEKFTYRQRKAFVYIIGKRAEAGFIHDTNISPDFGTYIRGRFSSVKDANVYETSVLASSVHRNGSPTR